MGANADEVTKPEFSNIAARAADIYERAAVTRRPIAESDPDPSAAEAVHAWNRAFSPGNPAAFLERLTWDDLDLETVVAAAADPHVVEGGHRLPGVRGECARVDAAGEVHPTAGVHEGEQHDRNRQEPEEPPQGASLSLSLTVTASPDDGRTAKR